MSWNGWSCCKVVDTYWMDHIDAMDELRRGIGLQAYAQQDPVVAYKREGFDMFDEMIAAIKDDTARTMLHRPCGGPKRPSAGAGDETHCHCGRR